MPGLKELLTCFELVMVIYQSLWSYLYNTKVKIGGKKMKLKDVPYKSGKLAKIIKVVLKEWLFIDLGQ